MDVALRLNLSSKQTNKGNCFLTLALSFTHVKLKLYFLSPSAVDRQEELIPEHPNNSNIRCSPQDKRCIQKTLARLPPKSTNQRSNREDPKLVLVRRSHLLTDFPTRFTGNTKVPLPWQVFLIRLLQLHIHQPKSRAMSRKN